jgi:hypothetical protein
MYRVVAPVKSCESAVLKAGPDFRGQPQVQNSCEPTVAAIPSPTI